MFQLKVTFERAGTKVVTIQIHLYVSVKVKFHLQMVV